MMRQVIGVQCEREKVVEINETIRIKLLKRLSFIFEILITSQ